MVLNDFVGRRPAQSNSILAPGRNPLTFGGLTAQIDKTVHFLNTHGLGRNDRVAAVLPNGPELAVAFLAVSAGATFAPLNPAYTVAEFQFYLGDLGARALITIPGFCAASVEACSELGIPVFALQSVENGPAGTFHLEGSGSAGRAPQTGFAGSDDAALMLHSSGTTSRPKLIPLSHRNLCASARNIAESLTLSPADRCLNIMPLFHVHGLIGGLLSTMAAGGTISCTPGFHAHRFFRWMEDANPTWYTAVPTMHQVILSRIDASLVPRHRLRFIRSCSASLHMDTWRQMEQSFECPVVNAYGMTEASHQIASNPLPPADRRPGSVGLATGTEVAILNESGDIQPPGTTGEVACRGDAITSGYLSPAEANQSAFCNGWLRTGDRGILDADGYLTLTGRLKEIINCGGEKIAPSEIDDVLMNHPAVAGALAFGASCPQYGERVYAAVVLRSGCGTTESVLKSFAGERLAKFKVPKKILFVDEIPKGPTGKMQRIGMAKRMGLE
jgi:acyl-CoA synthetase (AMP-forming)/AMP-acid ligase II